MSPEIIQCETDKERDYDNKTDVWSLGITCIELAEGEPPLTEFSSKRVLLKIIKSDPPKLKHPDRWSHNFIDFISKCLKKDPEQRYSSSNLLKVYNIIFFLLDFN